MKKKLIFTILSILTCSFIVLTALFTIIINHQYTENTKKTLKQNNDVLISFFNTENIKDKETLFKKNYSSVDIRVTLIDKEGKVIYDSVADRETMDNHNTRKEVLDARVIGNGFSERFSHSINKNMLYYATAFGDGYIMRSSMPMAIITNFEETYLRYYIITVILVLAMAMAVSLKFSQVILEPIKNLQFITSQVAYGELDRRVKAIKDDEIGQLAKTFNNMADKLQDTLKDVTDKQNRLSAILQSMDSGVIAIDKNNKVIMINSCAEDIFGINRDIIGLNLLDIIRNFELEEVFKNKHENNRELKIWWPKERELRIKTTDIRNEWGLIGTVAVVQDITDLKRLENMRSEFVANVSHELKTPLTSIKGFAETLKYVDDAATKEKFLNIIDDEAERLTRLINDILTLSYIEQHGESKTESINVNEIIENVYNLLKNTADLKKINVEILGDKVPELVGDRDRFKQMVLNLVDNAIKYSEESDKVFVETKVEENNVVLSVRDTGVGMTKEHQERIFERFYRVDKARSRAQGGTGLGLAIVKHIILSLNGTIDVESELGVGTKFTIKIPINRTE
ncbi:two-component system histidine kinase PnpS [Clostridium omnivorum]|uniref:histidine kinase n=1 Tax=Clostridium omnivorum TaxID=1604902 RepID=A0ABQ5NC60_9CLOT|nr:cell wall metabolism sensor histidine kinase WalK [Clostridium sp. E14]GLC32838.1 PAS domain-containing sensor histidine kinase [Clostridium sp. E14]